MDFSGPALIMAIINCTDDSFYAPSGIQDITTLHDKATMHDNAALHDKALEMALVAEREGAAIIDFGGESSRPGSSYISCELELERVIPVIAAFRKRSTLPVSVDTRKAAVARQALDAGADIINDISGLSDDPGIAALCAERGAGVVLMHKKGDPLTMQESPFYVNLVEELRSWFKITTERAMAEGISAEKIIIDPGFGFGKGLEDNLEILRRLAEICGKDYPVLVGLSRKSFIGEITGRDVEGRLSGTLAANGAAIMGGAEIIRVHDVKEHVDLAKFLFTLH
ncbi:MAG: dihydropteroate synthase [Treponema sp.]|nr:dihydropteroate synthase [Treponema sp.]